MAEMPLGEAMQRARAISDYAKPTVGERAAVVLAAEVERLRSVITTLADELEGDSDAYGANDAYRAKTAATKFAARLRETLGETP